MSRLFEPFHYGNPDCQASEGFAKHVAEGEAEVCCYNQTFSR